LFIIFKWVLFEFKGDWFLTEGSRCQVPGAGTRNLKTRTLKISLRIYFIPMLQKTGLNRLK